MYNPLCPRLLLQRLFLPYSTALVTFSLCHRCVRSVRWVSWSPDFSTLEAQRSSEMDPAFIETLGRKYLAVLDKHASHAEEGVIPGERLGILDTTPGESPLASLVEVWPRCRGHQRRVDVQHVAQLRSGVPNEI